MNEEKKDKLIQSRIDGDLEERFLRLTQKFKLNESELIRQMIRVFDSLDPNGLDVKAIREKIMLDELKMYEDKEKIRLRGETFLFDLREGSKDKDRSLSVRLKLMGEYIKTLDDAKKKELFDREFHLRLANQGEELKALPVLLEGKGYEVHINGIRVVVKELLKDGRTPKLDFNQDRLIVCEEGFHTKGSWCSKCPNITTCPIVRDERLDHMARKF